VEWSLDRSRDGEGKGRAGQLSDWGLINVCMTAA